MFFFVDINCHVRIFTSFLLPLLSDELINFKLGSELCDVLVSSSDINLKLVPHQDIKFLFLAFFACSPSIKTDISCPDFVDHLLVNLSDSLDISTFINSEDF